MRFLPFFLLYFASATVLGQSPRLVGQDFGDYYDWYHQRSQVNQLYQDRATLFAFWENTPVHKRPSFKSERLGEVKIGAPLTNHVSESAPIHYETFRGYTDFWYNVSGYDTNGRYIEGYVFGGAVAKSWHAVDQSASNMVLLGVSTRPRSRIQQVEAEIRVIERGHLRQQSYVPGLCVFEECKTSSMLRVLHNSPVAGSTLIEVSTLTISCAAGAERAYYFWDRDQLRRIYHTDLVRQEVYFNQALQITAPRAADHTTVCHYKGMGNDFEPIWQCQGLNGQSPAPKAKVPIKRAR